MLRSACYSFGIIILEMRVLLWFVIASRSDCSSVREHSDRSKRYAMQINMYFPTRSNLAREFNIVHFQ